MSNKGKHPNSIKNLEKRKTIKDTPGAWEAGQAAIKRKLKIRQLLNETLTLEEALDMINTIKREAKNGNAKFMELLINMNENYKNREIKAKNKTNELGQSLLDHIQGIKVEKPLDIPTTDYEELNRSPE